MPSHFTALDMGVLAVYFLASMGIGFYFWSRSRSVEGFTAAGRSLPGWVAGMSIFATYLSSISFIGLPGKAFASNWNSFVFSLSLPIATLVAVRWFLPYYRRTGEVSAYSHLEKRFGPWARVYAGLCYLLTQIARMGAVMYLTAMPLKVLLGWDIETIIIVMGISVTIYSFVGGLVAVAWADAMQGIVLIAGAITCAVVLPLSLPDGPGQMFAIASEAGKFSLGSFGPSMVDTTFWVVLAYGLFMNLQNFGIDQNYIQRYVASSSDREARKSVWLGGLLYIPVSALFFFIGTALFAYHTAHGGVFPAEYASDKTDYVLPYYIVTVLPPGVRGLLIAAIFAAAMSTLSTSLNSSATLLMTDYYKRFIRKGATERQSMKVLYAGTIAWGAIGTTVALAMTSVKNVLDVWWMLSGIFSGGMLGLFLLGMISRKARNPSAATGVVAGVLVIVWMTLSLGKVETMVRKVLPRWQWPAGLQSLRSPFHEYLIIVFGTTAILLVGLLAVTLARGRGRPGGKLRPAPAEAAAAGATSSRADD